MYIGVMRYTLEAETFDPARFEKDAKHLCEGLRQRFKVLAKAHRQETGYFAVTAMADTEAAIDKKFDAVLAYTEERGMGRILEDERLVAMLDDLFAYDQDPDEAMA